MAIPLPQSSLWTQRLYAASSNQMGTVGIQDDQHDQPTTTPLHYNFEWLFHCTIGTIQF